VDDSYAAMLHATNRGRQETPRLTTSISHHKSEVDALKSRLHEASDALNRIEKRVLLVSKDSPQEVHDLASDVLNKLLGSADQVRSKETGFIHAWEARAYDIYNSGRNDELTTLAFAHHLIEKTKLFFQ
jgi:hypothetical protein